MTDDATNESGDRREDGITRDRINEIGRNYNRFAKLVLILFYIQVASLFTFGILSVFLTNENHKRSEENAKLLVTIQQERRNNIIDACQDQNSRHDNSIAKLNEISAENLRKNPKNAVRINAGVKTTKILINSILPVRDCVQLANEAVNVATTTVTP